MDTNVIILLLSIPRVLTVFDLLHIHITNTSPGDSPLVDHLKYSPGNTMILPPTSTNAYVVLLKIPRYHCNILLNTLILATNLLT